MNDKNSLMFAALLHDIGKFYQRTKKHHDSFYNNLDRDDFGSVGAHSKWSADYIKNFSSLDNPLVEDLALYHHNNKKSINPTLCEMLAKADSHSSFEREKEDDTNEVNKEPLISIFSHINLYGNEINKPYYMKLNELQLNDSFDNMKPVANKKECMSGYNLTPEYTVLWNKFIDESDNTPADFSTWLYLLKKYTSCIPSAAYKSVPDISLYDHSKTTAALALVRYIYSIKCNDYKKSVDTQPIYLMVNGDLSGIQKFIYKISSPEDAQKGMSKRLRGRSLYISLLVDSIVEYIIKELELSKANILFSAGGRFTILVDNTNDSKNKLNEISKSINDYFIDKFNSELYISFVWQECTGEDLKDFGHVTDKLNSKLADDKKHKFLGSLDKVFALEESIKYENTCSVCGNIISNEEKCDECDNHEAMGSNIANCDYLIKCFSSTSSELFDMYIKPTGVGYIFKTKNNNIANDISNYCDMFDYVEVSRLNDTNFLELSKDINKDNVSFTFSFIGNSVAQNNASVLSFEELANTSTGANKIGILKMDVDDLGQIFSEGFKYSSEDNLISISRVSTLSSYLDLFFLGFINEFASKYDLYINYSGGDDLLVIGAYDKIILFANEIRAIFKQWTCNNKSISISGGISIVGSKFPIGKAIQLADNNLNKSKTAGKDKITLFNETLSWDDDGNCYGFDSLIKYSKYLEDNVINKDISKGFVYSLLKIWQMSAPTSLANNDERSWKKNNANKVKHKAYVPYYKYKLRLIKNKDVLKYLDKIGIKYMPWIKIPVSWVSLRTR